MRSLSQREAATLARMRVRRARRPGVVEWIWLLPPFVVLPLAGVLEVVADAEGREVAEPPALDDAPAGVVAEGAAVDEGLLAVVEAPAVGSTARKGIEAGLFGLACIKIVSVSVEERTEWRSSYCGQRKRVSALLRKVAEGRRAGSAYSQLAMLASFCEFACSVTDGRKVRRGWEVTILELLLDLFNGRNSSTHSCHRPKSWERSRRIDHRCSVPRHCNSS